MEFLVFRAIIWKEIREQGLISLTLLVLGSAVIIVAATQAPPGADTASPGDVVGLLGLGRLATLMLSVTAGMVCGSAIFAAERESGTMTFLESLPASHAHLWRAKLAAGVGLTLVQVIVLESVSASLGLMPTIAWAVAVCLYSLLAYVWGLLGSTITQSTLGSVGVAVPAACVTMVVAAIPVLLFFQVPGSLTPRPVGTALFFGLMFATPLLLSSWFFTRWDRQRKQAASDRAGSKMYALCWLAFRQSLLPGAVLSAFALVLGLCLLAPGARPFLVWPGLSLIAGAIAGVLAFADEQSHGSSRYWSEQRLPLGRVWLVKIVCYLLFALWLMLVAAAPLMIRAQFSRMDPMGISYGHSILASVFLTPLFDELGGQGLRFLLLPAIYGFAAGHLCGLMFRKLVVACAVACLIGGAGALLWEPSLLAGGVAAWQIWLPPLFLLGAARLLIGAWSAERLSTRQPLGILIGGSAAAVGAMALGISFRLLEVPNFPNGEEDIRFVAKLTPFEENIAGRDFKNAAMYYAEAVSATAPQYDRPNADPPPPQPNSTRRLRVEERLEMTPARGWPINDPNLEAWLLAVFAHKPAGRNEVVWHELAAAAAALPLGIYEHPQLIGPMGVAGNSLEYARRMSIAILAHGLLQEARGDAAAFIPAFKTVLELAQTLRNGSVVACLLLGNDIERLALACLNRWLEALPPQAAWLRAAAQPFPQTLASAVAAIYEAASGPRDAKLMRALLSALEKVDPTEPFDSRPQFLAERYVVREALKAPTSWLPQILGLPPTSQGADPVMEMVALAWTVPWERERTRRLVGLGYESGAVAAEHSFTHGRPGANYLLIVRNRAPAELDELDRQMRAYRRAMILGLALRIHRAEQGVLPASLHDLAAKGCLRRLPPDPYDESRTFGYRISTGEVLRGGPRIQLDRPLGPREDQVAVMVTPGQPIVWSVGPDHIDQGGMNPPGVFSNIGKAEDIVFLVPLGPCQ